MGVYEAKVAWSRGDQPFLDKRYSRAHSWTFDGGAVVPGIASLSSCHMLWFLAFAANAGLVVDTYVDEAFGKMGKNDQGRGYIAEVTLNPCTSFTGRVPTQDELDALHHQAHDHCEMAHSVRATITTIATIG